MNADQKNPRNPGNPRLVFLGLKGGSDLNFQVKGQEYFLAFVEDERRWYVFAPTQQGVQKIPVYVDAPSAQRTEAERVIPKLPS